MTEGMGTCPACNGNLRVPCENESTRHYGLKYGWYGYDKETDTIPCGNCGGQYQWGNPTGEVLLRKDNGEPCVHEYRGYSKGRCYTGYTCIHCGDEYSIDSGD